MSDSVVDLTKLRFFSQALPVLFEGQYTIKLDQEIRIPSQPTRTYSYQRTFHVQGPKFGLGAADVHGVFPPASSQGQFETVLPHIVLRRRTLPWEVIGDHTPSPWMALLLFHPGELADAGQTHTIHELTTSVAGILNPTIALGPADDPKAQVRTIDVPQSLFLQIAPKVTELPLLAHVRQVSTEDKELLALQEDGWFSVVIANRLPVALSMRSVVTSGAGPFVIQKDINDLLLVGTDKREAVTIQLAQGSRTAALLAQDINAALSAFATAAVSSTGALTISLKADNQSDAKLLVLNGTANDTLNFAPRGGVNNAHLVSLDGWKEFLTQRTARPGVTSLRLISLASWSFTSFDTPGNFADLIQKMDVGPLQFPVPNKLKQDTTDEGRFLKGALNNGYVPLTYDLRHGEHTAAWYRGPLLPVVRAGEDRDPFETSEAGLVYDNRSGMFDASYAVAWQIGRLLALSDLKFSDALSEWRQDGNRILDNMLEKASLQNQFNTQKLWVSVRQIEDEPDEATKVKLAVQFLADLTNPKVFSSRLARMALDLVQTKLNLSRAVTGTKSGPFQVPANAALTVSDANSAATVVLATTDRRLTTDEVIDKLNSNRDFSKLARACRANDIDGQVAIFAAVSPVAVNSAVLGFAAGTVTPAEPTGGSAVAIARPVQDTKDRLAGNIRLTAAQLQSDDIRLASDPAQEIRKLLLSLAGAQSV